MIEAEDELCRAIRRRGRGVAMDPCMVAGYADRMRLTMTPDKLAQYIRTSFSVHYYRLPFSPSGV